MTGLGITVWLVGLWIWSGIAVGAVLNRELKGRPTITFWLTTIALWPVVFILSVKILWLDWRIKRVQHRK